MSWKKVNAFGPRSILVEWEKEININIHDEVIKVRTFIEAKFPDKLIDTVPAYQSLCLHLTSSKDQLAIIKELENIIIDDNLESKAKSRQFNIPVCFQYGLDLDNLCREKRLSRADFIQLFINSSYPIFFLGFLPGFPYLGGLPDLLHTPRKAQPRPQIERGSVAIGGGQAGIYPSSSPGGWNIIGKTPISIIKKHGTLFQAGDRISFYEINKSQFYHLLEKDSMSDELIKPIS